MNSLSVPTRANSAVIEQMYQAWLDNPDSVDPTWRAFFQGFALGNGNGSLASALAAPTDAPAPAGGVAIVDSLKQASVHYLINAYRAIGHLQSHLDPLNDAPAPVAKLSLEQFNL